MVVGLDNSGKSTYIEQIRQTFTTGPLGEQPEPKAIAATVGYTQEVITIDDFEITFQDMSGQSKYRDLWEHFYQACHALIFVVDASDLMRV